MEEAAAGKARLPTVHSLTDGTDCNTCQTPQAVWPRGSGGQVPGSLPCSPNMHMAHSRELEAASRSSETYLAENGGGRVHQGSRRHRTELPGAHSRERLRHRQAPNDDICICELQINTLCSGNKYPLLYIVMTPANNVKIFDKILDQ